MASRPPILIITGHGVNCEAESRHAWERAGADVTFLHLHDLLGPTVPHSTIMPA